VWVRALFWVTNAVAGSLVLGGNSVVGSLTQNERQQTLLLGALHEVVAGGRACHLRGGGRGDTRSTETQNILDCEYVLYYE